MEDIFIIDLQDYMEEGKVNLYELEIDIRDSTILSNSIEYYITNLPENLNSMEEFVMLCSFILNIAADELSGSYMCTLDI